MKKIISILLIGLICLGFTVGCGNSNNSENNAIQELFKTYANGDEISAVVDVSTVDEYDDHCEVKGYSGYSDIEYNLYIPREIYDTGMRDFLLSDLFNLNKPGRISFIGNITSSEQEEEYLKVSADVSNMTAYKDTGDYVFNFEQLPLLLEGDYKELNGVVIEKVKKEDSSDYKGYLLQIGDNPEQIVYFTTRSPHEYEVGESVNADVALVENLNNPFSIKKSLYPGYIAFMDRTTY